MELFDEKTGDQKSRDRVPLSLTFKMDKRGNKMQEKVKPNTVIVNIPRLQTGNEIIAGSFHFEKAALFSGTIDRC
jgi:hypothetical protein